MHNSWHILVCVCVCVCMWVSTCACVSTCASVCVCVCDCYTDKLHSNMFRWWPSPSSGPSHLHDTKHHYCKQSILSCKHRFTSRPHAYPYLHSVQQKSSSLNFIRPTLEATSCTVSNIIPVILLSPYLCICGTFLILPCITINHVTYILIKDTNTFA